MKTAPPGQSTLLDELEARQDEVLQKLSELNDRVETLLNQWVAEFQANEPVGVEAGQT
jgi:hypothetical protein